MEVIYPLMEKSYLARASSILQNQKFWKLSAISSLAPTSTYSILANWLVHSLQTLPIILEQSCVSFFTCLWGITQMDAP